MCSQALGGRTEGYSWVEVGKVLVVGGLWDGQARKEVDRRATSTHGKRSNDYHGKRSKTFLKGRLLGSADAMH